MATQLQLRKGSSAQTAIFTGATAEVTVDTDLNTLTVHDGSTAGGHYIARQVDLQAAFNKANTSGTTAQAGFDKANSATTLAQAAFNKANTDNTDAQAAFDKANSANILAQAAFNFANTSNIKIDSAYAWANTINISTQSAFTKANSANVLAQAAFDKANTSSTTAQAAFDFANTIISDTQVDPVARTTANAGFDKANSANVLAQSAYDTANIANTRTISSLANSSYTIVLRSDGQLIVPQSTQGSITAGYVTSLGSIGFNANGNLWKFGEDGTMLSPYSVQITTHGFQWPDGSYQNTAFTGTATDSTARTLAQNAYDYANTIISDTQVDPVARTTANSGFDKAISLFVIVNPSPEMSTVRLILPSAFCLAFLIVYCKKGSL